MNPYEAIQEARALAIGVPGLRALISIPTTTIEDALANGDKYLATIPLGIWDRCAGAYLNADGELRLSDTGPYAIWYGHGLDLSQRVAVLKHVARFHVPTGPAWK